MPLFLLLFTTVLFIVLIAITNIFAPFILAMGIVSIITLRYLVYENIKAFKENEMIRLEQEVLYILAQPYRHELNFDGQISHANAISERSGFVREAEKDLDKYLEDYHSIKVGKLYG